MQLERQARFCDQSVEDIRELYILRANFAEADRMLTRLQEVQEMCLVRFEKIAKTAVEKVILQRYLGTSDISKTEAVRYLAELLENNTGKADTDMYRFCGCLLAICNKQ